MHVKFFAVSALVLLSPVYPIYASSFSQLTVFGDSLSDNGNAYLITNGTSPGPNYGTYTFPGTTLTTEHYSDGPNTTPMAAGPQGLWVDQLASKLGVADPLPVLSQMPNASDYAVGGAQTGSANVQDVGNQIALFSATHPSGASSTGLYAFWAGANDILHGNSPTQAADNIEQYISALSLEGAKNFVWLNLPLLGDTPDGAADKTALNAASVMFNDEWATDIAALEGKGIKVDGVNIESLFVDIIGDPAKYGFTNVTVGARGLNLPTDAGYLSWDGLHPTTAGHALVADAVYNSLTTPTPEPSSIGFAVIGIGAVVFGLRKRLSPDTANKS